MHLPFPLTAIATADTRLPLYDFLDLAEPLLRHLRCTLESHSLAAGRNSLILDDLKGSLAVLAGQAEILVRGTAVCAIRRLPMFLEYRGGIRGSDRHIEPRDNGGSPPGL